MKVASSEPNWEHGSIKKATCKLLLLGETPFQLLDKLRQRRAQHETDCSELKDIDDAFATLDFAHKRLRNRKHVCQFDLRDSSVLPNLRKQLDDLGVFLAVNGLFHAFLAPLKG